MKIVTIAEALEQCRADAEDTTLVTLYADAAEAACEKFCNRAFFATAGAKSSAVDSVPSNLAAANTEYKASLASADANPDEYQREVLIAAAEAKFHEKSDAEYRNLHGLVADAAVKAAILLTTASFYANREEGGIPALACQYLRMRQRLS